MHQEKILDSVDTCKGYVASVDYIAQCSYNLILIDCGSTVSVLCST
jgi:hypothetical protein